MSEYVHKSHNVTVLLYHMVFPAKYRRAVFDGAVDEVLRDVCLEVEKRYQVKFLEIGTDKDHVHFLVQSVPTYSITKLVTIIKSVTAREVFRLCPHVKKQLWGGEFWTHRSTCDPSEVMVEADSSLLQGEASPDPEEVRAWYIQWRKRLKIGRAHV